MQTIDQQAKEFIVNVVQPNWLCNQTRVWFRDDYDEAMDKLSPEMHTRVIDYLYDSDDKIQQKLAAGTCTIADLDNLAV